MRNPTQKYSLTYASLPVTKIIEMSAHTKHSNQTESFLCTQAFFPVFTINPAHAQQHQHWNNFETRKRCFLCVSYSVLIMYTKLLYQETNLIAKAENRISKIVEVAFIKNWIFYKNKGNFCKNCVFYSLFIIFRIKLLFLDTNFSAKAESLILKIMEVA